MALDLPLFPLAMARDFGLIQPWLIGASAAMMAQMPGASMAELMPHIAARDNLLNWLFLAMATPVQFFSGRDFYVHAWKTLPARTANMDTLIALCASVAYFYSLWLLLNGGAGHVYFETAALIITLILVVAEGDVASCCEGARMKVFSATKMIDATPETIWAILTNAAAYPEWDPNADRLEGQIAPGETVTAYTKLSPGRAFPAKVSKFVPGRKMTWSGGMPLGLFKGVRTFTLTPQGEGTTLFTLREEFSGPLLGLIGGSIPDMTQPFEQLALGLKRRAEQGA